MPGKETNNGSMGRGRLLNWISLFLFFAVILAAIAFFSKNWGVFVDLVDLSPGYIVSMSLLIVAFQFLSGVKIKILTSIFGLSLRPREWFGLAQVNSLLNYLPVRGGGAANAFYLKGFFDFPITKYLAVITASFAVTVAVFSAAGCLATVTTFLLYGLFAKYTFSIYIALILLTAALFSSVGWIGRRVKNRHLSRFLSGWEKIRGGGWRLSALVAADFALITMDAMRIKLSYGRLGYHLDYFMGLMMVPVSNIASVVSMVPGGIVAREFVMGLVSGEIGMGFDAGVFASALDRVILFIWILIMGSMSIAFLNHYRRDSFRGDAPGRKQNT
jgi:uncharacterized membrane protein YbhN (UPF0104 family)